MRELDLMKILPYHPNVVKLLGFCIEKGNQGNHAQGRIKFTCGNLLVMNFQFDNRITSQLVFKCKWTDNGKSM